MLCGNYIYWGTFLRIKILKRRQFWSDALLRTVEQEHIKSFSTEMLHGSIYRWCVSRHSWGKVDANRANEKKKDQNIVRIKISVNF